MLLFILTFLGQNFEIPSGSMRNALLVGDHLIVDRITLAPPTSWMPFVHHRESSAATLWFSSNRLPTLIPWMARLTYPFLVKRLVGLPTASDRMVCIALILKSTWRRVRPVDGKQAPSNPGEEEFLTNFLPCSPVPELRQLHHGSLDCGHLSPHRGMGTGGAGQLLHDGRQTGYNSADSRFWGFVPRENIVGRPLLNYWSFETPDDQEGKTGIGNNLAWMGHVALHFFTDTALEATIHAVKAVSRENQALAIVEAPMG